MSDDALSDAFDSAEEKVEGRLGEVGGLATALGRAAGDAIDHMSPASPLADGLRPEADAASGLAEGHGSVGDLAAEGGSRVLDGDPREVWHEVEPDDAVPKGAQGAEELAGAGGIGSLELGMNAGATAVPDEIDAVTDPGARVADPVADAVDVVGGGIDAPASATAAAGVDDLPDAAGTGFDPGTTDAAASVAGAGAPDATASYATDPASGWSSNDDSGCSYDDSSAAPESSYDSGL